jgi:hypothetical protein
MLKQFLKLISIKDITFLSDVNKDFFIDKSGKSHYYEINNFEIENFSNFIHNLSSNSLYTIIPIIYIKGKPDDPYITLSKSILVTKYSDYRLFHHYIFERFLKSKDSFEIIDDDFSLVLKYKRVKLDIGQIKRRFK